MKYIHNFKTQQELENYRSSANYTEPFLGFVESTESSAINVQDLQYSFLPVEKIGQAYDEYNIYGIYKITMLAQKSASGTVSIELEGNTFTTTLNNGIAIFNNVNSQPGVNNIQITYTSSTLDYNSSTFSDSIEFPKLDIELSIELYDITVGETFEINCILSAIDATGNIDLIFNNSKYTTISQEGKAYYELTNTTVQPGTYIINAIYNGDDKYNKAYISDSIEVLKVSTVMEISIDSEEIDIDMYAVVVNIILPVDVEASDTCYPNHPPVIVILDGSDIRGVNITDGRGCIYLECYSGTHTITSYFYGDDKYLPCYNQITEII